MDGRLCQPAANIRQLGVVDTRMFLGTIAIQGGERDGPLPDPIDVLGSSQAKFDREIDRVREHSIACFWLFDHHRIPRR
jgi:hypothetical protein